MTCSSCGNSWALLLAHIVSTRRTPEGCLERVQCPACGFEEEITRPDVAECDGD